MLAPLPVVLVGCAHEELGRNLLTIAWCGVQSSDPPTIHVSIRPERHSYRMIMESGCFTANIPTADIAREVDLCGRVSGADGDKFDRSGLTALPGSAVDAPIVAECPVNIECEVTGIFPTGVHHVFTGEVAALRADESALTDGKLDFTKIPLITYVNGDYWSLGEVIGRHGFSSG